MGLTLPFPFFILFGLYCNNKTNTMETGQIIALCVVGLLIVGKITLLVKFNKPRG